MKQDCVQCARCKRQVHISEVNGHDRKYHPELFEDEPKDCWELLKEFLCCCCK